MRRAHSRVRTPLVAALLAACEDGRVKPPITVTEAAVGRGGDHSPDCALQSWMVATLEAGVRARDFARLRLAFDDKAGWSPAEMAAWTGLAPQGAEPVERCRSCDIRPRAD